MKSIFIFLFLLLATDARGETHLWWNPSQPLPDRPVESQTIYRRAPNGEWALLATVGPSINEMIDATTAIGNSYCYKITGWNTAGESGPSNEACIAVGGLNLTVGANRTVVLSRRATNGSTIIGILVNRDEQVTVNNEIIP